MISSPQLLSAFLLLCISLKGCRSFVVPTGLKCTSGFSSTCRFMARFQIEYEEDYYFTLNVTRAADPSEIRRNYRILAKQQHPDVFVDELRFDPETMSVADLKKFLESERVSTLNVVDKYELVQKARTTHKRTQNLPEELAKRKDQIQARFSLLNAAYDTLYDENKRKMYNLSGDWGIPGLSGKQKKTDGGIGDREEAERKRKRQQAAQRDPIQERVYQQYITEKAEKAQKEAEAKKKRDQRIAREKEQRRKQREQMGLSPEMTAEEQRIANQEKVKKMWVDGFDKFFGGMTK